MKIRVPSSVQIDHTRRIAFCDRETLARPMDFDKAGNPIKYAMSCPFCGAGIFSDLITDLYCTSCKAGYVEEVPKEIDPFVNPLFAQKTSINVINNIPEKPVEEVAEVAKETLAALKNIDTPVNKVKPKNKATPKLGNQQRGAVKGARKEVPKVEPKAEAIPEQIVVKDAPESLITNIDDIDNLLTDESLQSLIDD